MKLLSRKLPIHVITCKKWRHNDTKTPFPWSENTNSVLTTHTIPQINLKYCNKNVNNTKSPAKGTNLPKSYYKYRKNIKDRIVQTLRYKYYSLWHSIRRSFQFVITSMFFQYFTSNSQDWNNRDGRKQSKKLKQSESSFSTNFHKSQTMKSRTNDNVILTVFIPYRELWEYVH